jgi:hypothetical protein
MPTGSEIVRYSGKTGSDRLAVKTALLTRRRYWLIAVASALLPRRSFNND